MTEKDFWDKFNRKHNPEYYAKKKAKEKKKKNYRNTERERDPIFKVSSGVD